MEPLLTLGQVATLLRASHRHVRNLMADGDLVGINIGAGKKSVWRFETAEVQRFFQRRRMFNGNLPRPASVKQKRPAVPSELASQFFATRPAPSEKYLKRKARLPPANGRPTKR